MILMRLDKSHTIDKVAVASWGKIGKHGMTEEVFRFVEKSFFLGEGVGFWNDKDWFLWTSPQWKN